MAGLAAIIAFGGYARGGKLPLATEAKEEPFTVEYYYKAKWGHADEFLALFKKNHYPVLKKEMEIGRILRVSMISPRLHASRRRPLGLSRDHRVQKCRRGQR